MSQFEMELDILERLTHHTSDLKRLLQQEVEDIDSIATIIDFTAKKLDGVTYDLADMFNAKRIWTHRTSEDYAYYPELE